MLSNGWALYGKSILPLAWVTSSLALYGCTPYVAIMIAFGLCYHIFAIVWLYIVQREHCCLWLGLTHLCYHIWLYPYGASIIAFGLGYLIFAIVWLYVVWREHYCLWPGLIHLCYHMAVLRKAQVFFPLAWATSSLPSYGCTSYGASIIAFGLG